MITASQIRRTDCFLERLETLLATLPEGHRGRAWVDAAAPEAGLVSATESADLLVVGSREPAALERWMRGTMATRVLRDAQCAVLVPRAEHPPPTPAQLLVGVDIGDVAGAERVTRLAAAWAERLKGRLSAAYAIPQALPHIADPTVRERAEKEWQKQYRGERVSLQELLDAHVASGHRGEARLLRGEPDDALIRASNQVDLLVVGNREREGLARLLGTVAQRVARHAACDVLSLPTASHT